MSALRSNLGKLVNSLTDPGDINNIGCDSMDGNDFQ